MNTVYFDTVVMGPDVGYRAVLDGVYSHHTLSDDELARNNHRVTTSVVQSVSRHTETGTLAVITMNTVYVQRFSQERFSNNDKPEDRLMPLSDVVSEFAAQDFSQHIAADVAAFTGGGGESAGAGASGSWSNSTYDSNSNSSFSGGNDSSSFDSSSSSSFGSDSSNSSW